MGGLMDEGVKGKLEMLGDEVKNLYNMENWGTTLFLTAIALCFKQLMDWSIGSPENGCEPISFKPVVYLLPALIGLTGFFFQRSVNYGIRRTRTNMYMLLETSKSERKFQSIGLIGWLMGSLPLGFGYAGTWYFSLVHPEVKTHLPCLLLALVFSLVCAFGAFLMQNRDIRAMRSMS